jgi:hypothetical protein
MQTTKYRARAKQDWQIGETVKVGFVSDLEVIKKIATPGDYRPDIYVLWQAKTNRFYSFQPHFGLCRYASLAEALSAN